MRILIADDERLARERLRRLSEEVADCKVVGTASSGAETIRLADAVQPDVVLLDIRMPAPDGLETARHLIAAEPPPAIIFTTAYSEHALEAFEAQAVDYLVKPIRLERLRQALAGARRPSRAQVAAAGGAPREQLCARLGGELHLIPVADVHYFRAEHKYVTVRHSQGEIPLEEPLKALEDEFALGFLRVHRQALVAPAWVGGLARTAQGSAYLWFHDIADTVSVSRRHLAQVRRRLSGAARTPRGLHGSR